MSLPTPTTVQKLREALHAKAKQSPDYRFYTLYDKIYRKDVLWTAHRRCLLNDGAPGVDRQTFADIEAYGVERWLDELAEELRSKTYRPQAVRRVHIPKPDGKPRPLGIPTVKDRVVQTAALLVLEPIFEADLQPEQHAYRPETGALDAVEEVQRLLRTGHTEVVDADLSGYFDSIPHAELMTSVARRVSDKHVLHLIKMWLEAPVEEIDERGRTQRTTRNKDTGRGTPQGAPISPLLSNLYMRRFILGWKALGHEHRLEARIVNYADDFVICCRGTADEAMAAMRTMMGKLKLTVNETKTHVCRLPEETFDFLGYTFGRFYSPRTGIAYLGARPSQKKVQRLCRETSEMTASNRTFLEEEDLVGRLNRKMKGWANYFRLGSASRAYRAIDQHVVRRLRQWLCRKHKVQDRKYLRFPDPYLYQELGLFRLRDIRRSSAWANA
ncbi:MAG: group II intron reverse transcriptase/maturase [Planctomycetia bacterium]|nr:group II intron reverse transcriptase/maturase [Planctomycetia bacterium]